MEVWKERECDLDSYISERSPEKNSGSNRTLVI